MAFECELVLLSPDLTVPVSIGPSVGVMCGAAVICASATSC